jgi:uncharacterized membrane protein
MSHLTVNYPHDPIMSEQKAKACLDSRLLKISLVVFGLLLIVAAIASHMGQVNAMAVYTMGGVGSISILVIVIMSVMRHLAQKRAIARAQN